MNKDKKYKIFKKVEKILPWLVLLPGIPAICFDNSAMKEYMSLGATEKYLQMESLFELFYDLSMIFGIVIIFVELLMGVLSCVFMIISFFKYQKIEDNVKRNFVLWIGPLFYSFGTLILMFLVHTFMYGMGV